MDEDTVTVTLSREDMIRVHELVVAQAVAREATEVAAMTGLRSGDYRRPADAIRRALGDG